MPEKKNKGLFDFASEHPYITLFVISDLAAMVTNVVGHICGRIRDGSRKEMTLERASRIITGSKALTAPEDESHDDPKPEET